MAKKIKKNITLNDLAGMIKRGFDENTKDHQQIFKRFDKIDGRVGNLENGQEKFG